MPNPALIIFDCDGVLVDSERISNQVLVDNLLRYGLDLTLDQSMAYFLGKTMASVESKAIGLGAELPDHWIAEVYTETYVVLAQSVIPVPGVADFLNFLQKRGIAFCVASHGSIQKMQITLGRCGFLPLFEHAMFSAHSIETSKPDPELFLLAAKTMGAAASDCWVIEDSASGAEAAQRGGMRCFGFASDTPAEKLTAFGAETFDRFRNLEAAFT